MQNIVKLRKENYKEDILKKKRALSLILASAIFLGQLTPIAFEPKQVVASENKHQDKSPINNTGKTKKENPTSGERATSSPALSNTDPQTNPSENLVVKTSLKPVNNFIYDYLDSYNKETEWEFLIKNESDKDIYLGEILDANLDENSPIKTSKNIRLRGFELSPVGFREENRALVSGFKYSYLNMKDSSTGVVVTRTSEPFRSQGFVNSEACEPKISFIKPVCIKSDEYLKIKFTTKIFNEDRKYPFSPEKWKRNAHLTEKDNKNLLNTDHTFALKCKFYFDKEGENPITGQNGGSNFNDQASASMKITGKIADLSFTHEANKTYLKKSNQEDYKPVNETPDLATGDTVRFIGNVKLSGIESDYKEVLERADKEQYLINPSFLIEEDAADKTLEEKLYLRANENSSPIKLTSTRFEEDGKTYKKFDFPTSGLAKFMESFDLIYDVKFINQNRPSKFDKKIKLVYANPNEVMPSGSSMDNLFITCKANYKDAKEVHQVVFNTGDLVDLPSQSVGNNEKIQKPNDPSKEGYRFVDWFADENYTTKFDFDKPITKATTIYGKFVKQIGISYEFKSGTTGHDLPKSIKDQAQSIEPVMADEGETINAPTKQFEPITVDDGTWTFASWDKTYLTLSEPGENKFVGTWTFKEKQKETDPSQGGGNTQNPNQGENEDSGNPSEEDHKGNNTDEENPGSTTNPEGNNTKEENPGSTTNPEGNNTSDNPTTTDNPPSPNEGSSGEKEDENKKDGEENQAPNEGVIRVNTDIYRPIPKGYQRIYFIPGEDGYLKYNPTFDYGQIIAFDIKETLTLGQAKAQDKGLIIPTVIPRDKSMKFVGWSPKLQSDEDFVEGMKYTALYEKIDQENQTDYKSNNDETDKQTNKTDGKLQKSSDNKSKHSKAKLVEADLSLAKEKKEKASKNHSPRTGVAGLELVSAILTLSSAGLYLSKKIKKD